MIKAFTLIVMLFSLSHAFAQKDLIDRLERQAIEIDSLKKVIKSKEDTTLRLSKENSRLVDTIQTLKFDFAKLDEFRKEKKNMDSIVRQIKDSIVLLKVGISERDRKITIEQQKAEQNAKQEFEKGKNEILTLIVNKYKSQSFDELLKSSSEQSVRQDLLLCQGIPEIHLILSDIQKYLKAKGILDTKLDAAQIKNQQILLSQIKRESVLLDNLKEIIINYQKLNDGLKESVERISAFDKIIEAASNKEVQKKKFDKILAELSSYIFNYDFNFSDYPYLSDIILELIKRKQPNADAEISDLLKKL